MASRGKKAHSTASKARSTVPPVNHGLPKQLDHAAQVSEQHQHISSTSRMAAVNTTGPPVNPGFPKQLDHATEVRAHPPHRRQNISSATPMGAEDSDLVTSCLVCFSWCGLFVCPCFLLGATSCVREYERVVIFRAGRVEPQPRGPGLFFYLPCTDTSRTVDLRTVTCDVPPQTVLTKDSVTVKVDAVVFYRVFDPIASVVNVQNADYSAQLLAQTSLRNVLGTKSLQEIMAQKQAIANQLQIQLDIATDPWGIKVERTDIKNVELPAQMQRAMASEAEATREAKAKIIAAKGEEDAANALKEAAQIIAQSPAALQLRYLQTLTLIASEKNQTVIFPLPTELLRAYVQKCGVKSLK